MKLLTDIPPRADGTVIARIPGVADPYIFAGKPLGCEIETPSHIRQLLATGNFFQERTGEDSSYSGPGESNPGDPDPGYDIKTIEVDEDGEGGLDPAAMFDIQAADAKTLREFIKAKTGQAPASATGLDKLRAIAETVAD